VRFYPVESRRDITHGDAIGHSMQHHLPILVVEITVLLQNGLAAETDGDRFLAVYMAKLSNTGSEVTHRPR
jgi:hypothetical protein